MAHSQDQLNYLHIIIAFIIIVLQFVLILLQPNPPYIPVLTLPPYYLQLLSLSSSSTFLTNIII